MLANKRAATAFACMPFRRLAGRRMLWLALAGLAVFGAPSAVAGEDDRLSAVLLTRDIGDPRAPGSAKLVLALPDSLAHLSDTAGAGDFRVYVYPESLSGAEGTDERYRAGGVYLWRFRRKIFLDIRDLPVQDGPGVVKVRVEYAPSGAVMASGLAEGVCRYTADAVDVVLAVDVSSSMLYTDPAKRRIAAAKAFIEMAEEGGGVGRVALVAFNHRAEVKTPLLPLTEGDRLLRDLARAGADGQTNLDEPLLAALRLLGDGETERPVVILLTDGRNEGSIYRETHLRCAEEGVRIFAVGLSERADHGLLEEMADATGGIYFRAPTDSDLPEIYARLAAELGKRYLMRAEILRRESGETVIPVDGTVKRVVAMSDGGARMFLTGPDGRGTGAGSSTGKLGSVFVGKPERGDWSFAWENASPGVSALALFGDTSFFLDVFPPQLQGGKLAVGATLAQGARPLGGGRVRIEPVPGLIAEGVELFDDGRHGDGAAADGVYGVEIDFNRPEIDRFDVMLRASGEVWDQGSFVRQTAGLVIRTREEEKPPPRGPRLGSDIDFGVLFPGETGSATVAADLDAETPGAFLFDLDWPGHAERMPRLSSEVVINPGRQTFEAEITIPEGTPPGDYRGEFSVRGDRGMIDVKAAKVRVGTVVFDETGVVDLGAVPPGTTAFRRIVINARADKGAPVEFSRSGDPGFDAVPDSAEVTAGNNSLTFEITASSPIGTPNQKRSAVINVAAGPGRLDIPVIWEIKAFEPAKLPGVETPGDISSMPEQLTEPPPLDVEFDGGDDWPLDRLAGAPRDIAGESPWERAERAIERAWDDKDRPSGDDGERASADAPADGGPQPRRDGDSFWSAWWLYILAAILALILLLLLLAYILYRLGSSSMIRFLLASLILNLVLLAIFIVLLGASVDPEAAPPETITVTFSEVGRGDLAENIIGESGMLAQGDVSDPAATAEGVRAEDGELSGSLAAGSVSMLPSERESASASSRAAAEFNASNRFEAVEMDGDPAESRPRRGPRTERIPRDMPEPEFPEIAEPEPDAGARRDESGRTDSADQYEDSGGAADVNAELALAPPAWRGAERSRETMAGPEMPRIAEAAEMEAVERDQAPAVSEARGRRRRSETALSLAPEPRIEINDPTRDNAATGPAADEEAGSDPAGTGVEEARLDNLGGDLQFAGARTGIASGSGGRRFDMEAGGEAVPVGFDPAGRDDSAPSGRRGRRPGRMAGGSVDESSPGGRTPSFLETASGGDAASGGRARPGRPAVDEARYDSGGGDAGDLLQALSDAVGNGSADGLAAIRAGRIQPGGGSESADDGRVAYDRNGGGQSMSRDRNPDPGGGDSSPRPGRAAVGDPEPGETSGGRDEIPGGYGADFNPSGSDPGGDQGSGPGGAQNGIGSDGGSGDGNPGGGETGGGPGGAGEDFAFGRGLGGGNGESRLNGLAGVGEGAEERPDIAGGFRLPSSNLDAGGSRIAAAARPEDRAGSSWSRNVRAEPRRGIIEASSAVDANSLLIVVGDFARLPDAAAENLFASLGVRRSSNIAIEERALRPGEANLGDCLLALLTPEETNDWSGQAIASLARYLRDGGHVWIDSADRQAVDALMDRLAKETAGNHAPLPASHQLSENGGVSGLYAGENLAVVATSWDWRRDWRYGGTDNGRTLRFLTRTLNFFLSGDAEQGIEIDDIPAAGGVRAAGEAENMPDVVAAPDPDSGARAWMRFEPGSERDWRTAPWGDALAVSSSTDGRGGETLKLDFDASQKGRMALYRTLNPPQDLSRAETVELDVYYGGDGAAALALILTAHADGKWIDYETPPAALRDGWNRVSFPIRHGFFRALTSSGGNFDSAVAGANQVGRAGFMLYRRGGSPGVILIGTPRIHDD